MKFTWWSLQMLVCFLLCHLVAFTLSSIDTPDVPQEPINVLSKKEDDTKAAEEKPEKIQETETDSKSVNNLEESEKKVEEAHQEGQDDSVESKKNIFSRGINTLASLMTKFSVFLVAGATLLGLATDINTKFFLPAFKGNPTFSWNALLNDTQFQKKVEQLKLKHNKKIEGQLGPTDLLEKCQQLMHSYWYLLLIGVIFICVSTIFLANNKSTRRRFRQIRIIQMGRSRIAALKKKRGSKTRKKRQTTHRRNGRANQ